MVAPLAGVDTPALVLDADRLQANAGRLRATCRARGVALRPHMKTLKSADAARIAVDPAHGGIAVATLNEAEYFAAHGFADIQYAVCMAPQRLARAARVLAAAPRFSFFVDSAAVARIVSDFAQREGVPFRVWIEIDCGEHRTGTDPAGPELLEIADALRAPVRLEGVATHAGHAYAARSREVIATIAEQERRAVVGAAGRLRAAGFDVPGVSAGSTPTATLLGCGDGLTEMRAGVYLAGDLFQAGLGVLREEDIALSVVATVIGHQRRHRRIIVDAGALALSKDRSTRELAGRDAGYGKVVDLAGRPSYGALRVDGVHQEHGEIDAVPDEVFERLPVGAQLRILPNHACMTAAMYPGYLVTRDGGSVARWARTNGWDGAFAAEGNR